MHIRSAARTSIAAAIVIGVGLLGPLGDGSRLHAADTLLPAPIQLFGTVPSCVVAADAIPSSSAVRVGSIITVTATFQAHCPQHLASRAVLIVVGGFPSTVAQPVRTQLGAFVDAVAAAGGSSAQLLRVDRAVRVPGWSTTEAQFEALARDVRTLADAPARSAEAWTATMTSAEQIVHALPPTKGPVLILVDGFRTANGSAVADAAATAAVAHTVRAVRDAAGRSVLFNVGDALWLRPVVEASGPSFENHLVLVHRVTGSLDAIMGNVLSAFHAPLTSWIGAMGEMEVGTLRPIAADQAGEFTMDGRILWRARLSGHAAALRVTGVFRAAEKVGFTSVLFQPRFVRAGRDEEFGPVAAARICIRPAAPGTPEPCPASDATPAPVPAESAVSRDTATAPTMPAPSPTRSPDAAGRPRIWLPRADRAAAGAAGG